MYPFGYVVVADAIRLLNRRRFQAKPVGSNDLGDCGRQTDDVGPTKQDDPKTVTWADRVKRSILVRTASLVNGMK